MYRVLPIMCVFIVGSTCIEVQSGRIRRIGGKYQPDMLIPHLTVRMERDDLSKLTRENLTKPLFMYGKSGHLLGQNNKDI